MSVGNAAQSGSSTQGGKFSTRWIISLVFLCIVNLFILYYFGVPVMGIGLVLSLFLLTSGKAFERERRLIQFLIVPGLLIFIVTAWVMYLALGSVEAREAFPILRTIARGANERTFLAILLGLVPGILVPVVIIQIYLLFNEDQFIALTGLDRATVRRGLRALFLNMNEKCLLVEDGEEKTMKPSGVLTKVGGMGMIIIRPGHAVVFEKSGKFTRIEFSGIHRVDRFERVYKIINLTNRDNLSSKPSKPDADKALLPDPKNAAAAPSKDPRFAQKVLTKDGISLDIDLQVYFRIRRKDQPREDTSLEFLEGDPEQQATRYPKPYYVDKEDVYKAAFNVGRWEVVIPLVAVDTLRKEVGQRSLDELFEIPFGSTVPVIRGEICDAIQHSLGPIVANWGAEVTAIIVGEVDIPPEVQKRLQEQWLAEKQRLITLTESEAQAQALTIVETARTGTKTAMLTNLGGVLEQYWPAQDTSSRLLMWLHFIEALQKSAEKPFTKLLFPYGIPLDDLEEMKKHLVEQGLRIQQARGNLPPGPTGGEQQNP